MNLSSPLEYGVQTTLVPSQSLNSSSITKSLTLQSSACIIGVLIPALTGDVIIDVYSVAGDGDVLKTSQTFSTTTDLAQIRVNDVMGVLRITVTAVATATLEVKIKAAHSVSTTGTVTLTESLKTQILNATDLDVTINYLDAGTCDERITSIEYDAPSVTSSTLLKSFNYTLVGSSYVLSGYTYTLS